MKHATEALARIVAHDNTLPLTVSLLEDYTTVLNSMSVQAHGEPSRGTLADGLLDAWAAAYRLRMAAPTVRAA